MEKSVLLDAETADRIVKNVDIHSRADSNTKFFDGEGGLCRVAALAASLTQDRLDAELQPELGKEDVMTSLTFLNTWHQKQCMCVFRDVKNLERFSLVVQCVTKISLTRLKDLPVSALRSPARMRLKVVMPGLPGWDVQASRRSLRSWRGRAECQQGGGQTCCRASTGKGFRQSHQ